MGERAYRLSLDEIKNLAEVVGKTLLGIIGICYVIGLCVVSVYLNNYGIHSLSLLRVNYITAGVWAILPILISLFTFFAVIGIFESLRRRKRRRHDASSESSEMKASLKGKLTWSMISNWFLFGSLTIVVGVLLGIELSGKWLLALLTGSFVVLSFLPLFHLFTRPAVPGTLGRSIRIGSILILAVLILFLHILVFANRVYRTIPSQIGGGGAQRVQVIFDEGKLPSVLMEASANSQGIQQSKDVWLLFVTDQEYVFIVKDADNKEFSIGIQRDGVKMILYK